MISIIGLVFALLLMLNGFAALRRPLDTLAQHDPIGKLLIEKRGEAFARRIYRIYGLGMVVVGIIVAYVSLGLLQG
ncbi:MAG: hypothetical protein ACUVRU_01940 [Anaerolineae bacterium]